MIPSYYRKIVSGQSNYLGMVISHKMIEKEMGYRGSKSEFLNPQPIEISVKEQRVDGSCFINTNLVKLRCTLMGCENSYPFKILSKQCNKVPFSTLDSKTKLNPWFITGFTDAEGCFSILIQPNTNYKTNWRVKAIFTILLHIKDIVLLENIKNTLG
jgi:LAGLIDADG endonuclease